MEQERDKPGTTLEQIRDKRETILEQERNKQKEQRRSAALIFIVPRRELNRTARKVH